MKTNWEQELSKGNIWRAKEILRGHIAQHYDQNEYAAYGKILYDCHDYYEAGKYLFCAGKIDDIRYRRAIDIFLERHENSFIFDVAPNTFRGLLFEELPLGVQKYFKESCGEEIINRINDYVHQHHILKNEKDNEDNSWKMYIYQASGMMFLLLLLTFFIVGMIQSVGWVIDKTVISNETKCIRSCGKWDTTHQECMYDKKIELNKLHPDIHRYTQ